MNDLHNNKSDTNPFDTLDAYKTIIENIHDGVFGMREGKIIYANASLLNMTGYTREELLGQSASFLTAPEHREMVLDIVD